MAKAKKPTGSSKKSQSSSTPTRASSEPTIRHPATDKESGKKSYAYDPHLDPQLIWAGKAERTSFEVPTVSLHVHERTDPRTIAESGAPAQRQQRPANVASRAGCEATR